MNTFPSNQDATHQAPIIVGRLASVDHASAFADEVATLIERYAREVVAAHGLCPYLHDITAGLGALCVVLDRDLDVTVAAQVVRSAESRVAHVVYPLATVASPAFERFGNAVGTRLREDRGAPLVHAAFHPAMEGGTENEHRLVGVLRRAPDPFLQFIPDGVQEGGTTIAGTPPPPPSFLASTFARLTEASLARLVAIQHELRDERRRRYARFEPELGPFR